MISVVIPLYNKAHTIINTLNTVFNQIYQDFEVIIIDDGSTDNSVEIINQNFTDNRIKIIRQKMPELVRLEIEEWMKVRGNT